MEIWRWFLVRRNADRVCSEAQNRRSRSDHAMLTAVLIDCAYKHRKHMQPSDDESESELEREDRSVLHSGKEWCERCE